MRIDDFQRGDRVRCTLCGLGKTIYISEILSYNSNTNMVKVRVLKVPDRLYSNKIRRIYYADSDSLEYADVIDYMKRKLKK